MRLVFDTESDELRHKATKLHCIVAKEIDTHERFVFYGDTTVPGDHGDLHCGVKFLLSASTAAV